MSLRPAHRSIRIIAACVAALSAPLAASADAGSAQRHEATRAFARTVATTPGQSFRIEHRYGDIQARGHASREIQIQAAIKGSAGTPE